MRILAITENKDHRFFSLLKPLEACGFQVGLAEVIDVNSINQFRPDAIIHNTGKIIPCGGLKINVDFRNIDPFIDVMLNKPVKQDKFYADFSFIGDISELDESLLEFVFKYKTKIYNDKPNGTVLYAGRVGVNDIYSIYTSSRGVLIGKNPELNKQRLMDITYSKSIPVSSVEEAKSVIVGNLEYLSVNKNYTNFDRVASIFKNNGLEKISKMILEKKKAFA